MLQGTKKLVVLGVAILVVALPGTAMAQSPTNDQYDDSSVTFLADPGDPVASDSSWVDETLPFSGLDVALLAAMGGGLVLLGFGMRRLTRRPDTA